MERRPRWVLMPTSEETRGVRPAPRDRDAPRPGKPTERRRSTAAMPGRSGTGWRSAPITWTASSAKWRPGPAAITWPRRLRRCGPPPEGWSGPATTWRSGCATAACRSPSATADLPDECVLPAGHGGEHQADVAPSALEVARRGADALAAVSTELADVLGWLVHDPERLGDRSELEELGRMYWKLSRDVDRLSPLLSALRTAKDKPAADVPLD